MRKAVSAVTGVRRSARLGGVAVAAAAAAGKEAPPPKGSKKAVADGDSVSLPSRKRAKSEGAAAGGAAEAKAAGGGGKIKAGGPTRDHEKRLWAKGFKRVAGVDEAGRGPLAGPVVAAACVLPEEVSLPGVNDSKQLTEAQREEIFDLIMADKRIQIAYEVLDRDVIDDINILNATLQAMTASVAKLPGGAPDYTLIDGNRVPKDLDPKKTEAIVKGDTKVSAIAAASIVAKVVRDRIMVEYDSQYPQYGFGKHKGYGVAAHMAAIHKHGPCPIHRRTFAPIKHMV